MELFCELLRKPQGKNVYWDANLQEKFQQAKDVICKLAKEGLTFYDKDRPTVVVTDWSEVGIGFVVLQQYSPCPMTETSCSAVRVGGASRRVADVISHPRRQATHQWRARP